MAIPENLGRSSPPPPLRIDEDHLGLQQAPLPSTKKPRPSSSAGESAIYHEAAFSEALFDSESSFSPQVMQTQQIIQNFTSSPCFFYCQNAKNLVKTPPQSEKEMKDRLCCIAYPVALGLARLHKLGLCHSNVKARHVQVASDRTGKLYGRLVDDVSVSRVGGAAKRVTDSYLDFGRSSITKNRHADTTDDMWAFSLFLFELVYGSQANPFLKLHEMNGVKWGIAYEKIMQKLFQENTPISSLLLKFFQSTSQRLTPEQGVEEIAAFVGKEAIEAAFPHAELVRSMQKIFRGTTGEALIGHPPQNEQEYKDRWRIALHAALFLRSLHMHRRCHLRINPLKFVVKSEPKCCEFVGGLCDEERSVRIGERISPRFPPYFDFSSPNQASPSHDIFSFGITLFELLHGKEQNPLQQLDCFNPEEWQKALELLKSKLNLERPDDRLILRCIEPCERRATDDEICKELFSLVGGTTALSFQYPPPSPQDYRARCVIAYDIVRQVREKGFDDTLFVSPDNIEILVDPSTGKSVGGRLIKQSLPQSIQLQPPQDGLGGHKRDIAFSIFTLFHGIYPLSCKLRDEKGSKTWERAVELMRRFLIKKDPIDQLIEKLLNDEGVTWSSLIGSLEMVLNGVFDIPRLDFEALRQKASSHGKPLFEDVLANPTEYTGNLASAVQLFLDLCRAMASPLFKEECNHILREKVHPADIEPLMVEVTKFLTQQDLPLHLAFSYRHFSLPPEVVEEVCRTESSKFKLRCSQIFSELVPLENTNALINELGTVLEGGNRQQSVERCYQKYALMERESYFGERRERILSYSVPKNLYGSGEMEYV